VQWVRTGDASPEGNGQDGRIEEWVALFIMPFPTKFPTKAGNKDPEERSCRFSRMS